MYDISFTLCDHLEVCFRAGKCFISCKFMCLQCSPVTFFTSRFYELVAVKSVNIDNRTITASQSSCWLEVQSHPQLWPSSTPPSLPLLAMTTVIKVHEGEGGRLIAAWQKVAAQVISLRTLDSSFFKNTPKTIRTRKERPDKNKNKHTTVSCLVYPEPFIFKMGDIKGKATLSAIRSRLRQLLVYVSKITNATV